MFSIIQKCTRFSPYIFNPMSDNQAHLDTKSIHVDNSSHSLADSNCFVGSPRFVGKNLARTILARTILAGMILADMTLVRKIPVGSNLVGRIHDYHYHLDLCLVHNHSAVLGMRMASCRSKVAEGMDGEGSRG